MSKYSEKLKDPRWQKKRLEVFERDGWALQNAKAQKILIEMYFDYIKENKKCHNLKTDL